MKTVVIHHSADYDGLFCREIAKKFMPQATLIGWDYGDPFPEVNQEDELYILDLNIAPLMNHPKLIWIDHHATAIAVYPATIKGYRIDGVAACRLAWQWFQQECNTYPLNAGKDNCQLPVKTQYFDRTVREPLAVRLAGEYDVWDKRDPNAELFQHGLKSRTLNANWWRDLLGKESEQYVNTLLESGKVLEHARAEEYKQVIISQGFDVQFEGLNFLACCSHEADIRSHLFVAGIKPYHQALLGFTWTGKDWRVSMYHAPGHEQHDLSQIALKHGGGGHRGACGFKINKLPFVN